MTRKWSPGVLALALLAGPAATSAQSAQPDLAPGGPNAFLLNGRFAVMIHYEISASQKGEATMVPLTNQLAAAYFVKPANLEVFVKLVSGCSINGFYWVYIAGLTDIRTIVTITQMNTGFTRDYINPSGTAFQPVQHTTAFPCSPGPPDRLRSGRWNGSTRVTASDGPAPACLPAHLQRGFTDVLAADVFAPRHLSLEQKALGGECYFFLNASRQHECKCIRLRGGPVGLRWVRLPAR